MKSLSLAVARIVFYGLGGLGPGGGLVLGYLILWYFLSFEWAFELFLGLTLWRFGHFFEPLQTDGVGVLREWDIRGAP